LAPPPEKKAMPTFKRELAGNLYCRPPEIFRLPQSCYGNKAQRAIDYATVQYDHEADNVQVI
jgi:hypothetical protein